MGKAVLKGFGVWVLSAFVSIVIILLVPILNNPAAGMVVGAVSGIGFMVVLSDWIWSDYEW